MPDAFATCEGQHLTALRVHVPGIGAWWADCDFADAPEVSGRVTIRVGSLSLSGTIAPQHAGTFGLQRRVRVVAGAGGWGSLLPARAYHNDAGIQARTVAEDAVREAGEELGASFSPRAPRIGIDYVREAGPASRALEDVIGGAPWWVDYDGRTNVGARAEVEADAAAYEVLEHDPRSRVVVLAIDDLTAVGIGSVLSERLDSPQTIRELEIEVGEVARARAWCGGVAGSSGRLRAAFDALVARATDDRLWGSWRYRFLRMSVDRVELQAIARDEGLPDLGPVSTLPGLAGSHSELTPGAEVLVEFVEGRRTMPRVTHFAGKDGNGWVPVETILAASSRLRLGSASASDGVALSSRVDSRNDDVAAALDAFCGAIPVANDGGAAIQTAVKAVWSGATPLGVPTPASDVGSAKVLAE